LRNYAKCGERRICRIRGDSIVTVDDSPYFFECGKQRFVFLGNKCHGHSVPASHVTQ
jgi:hypothetical protein